MYLPILFFLTALGYAMVGFGGGSTYLALLVLWDLPYGLIPTIALLCNIVVVSGGCYHFYRAGYFSWARILPFVTVSMPCAYLGGRMPIGQELFLVLLGISLAIAGVRLLCQGAPTSTVIRYSTRQQWIYGVPIGATIGLLSGLVGIGGGIFLAPILYFLRWGEARTIAAMASLLILLNSIAGFAGQLGKGLPTMGWGTIVPLLLAVLLGGQIGSRLASQRMPGLALQRLTALFVLVVSGRVFWSLL